MPKALKRLIRGILEKTKCDPFPKEFNNSGGLVRKSLPLGLPFFPGLWRFRNMQLTRFGAQ